MSTKLFSPLILELQEKIKTEKGHFIYYTTMTSIIDKQLNLEVSVDRDDLPLRREMEADSNYHEVLYEFYKSRLMSNNDVVCIKNESQIIINEKKLKLILSKYFKVEISDLSFSSTQITLTVKKDV